MKTLYVLCCRIASETFFKVGICSDLSRRIRALQTGNPKRIEPVKTYSLLNAERVEKLIHRALIVERTTGEWFRASDSTLRRIEDMVEQCGVRLPHKTVFRNPDSSLKSKRPKRLSVALANEFHAS